jgi:AcrR family transcriptional regulator
MSNYAPNEGTIVERPVKRSVRKRSLILSAAMHHFASHGYEAARVGDMASELGIAKGSVFQHFGSKDGLFLEAYKTAIQSLPRYLDVPDEVKQAGFFSVVRYRLSLPAEFWAAHNVANRIVLLGNYGSDLNLKKRISQYLADDDPLGIAELVNLGIARGEVRKDLDPTLITSFLECTFERMQDFLVSSEPDRALFNRTDSFSGGREELIGQFVTLLRGAIGTGSGN